jgi:hypothetical protein
VQLRVRYSSKYERKVYEFKFILHSTSIVIMRRLERKGIEVTRGNRLERKLDMTWGGGCNRELWDLSEIINGWWSEALSLGGRFESCSITGMNWCSPFSTPWCTWCRGSRAVFKNCHSFLYPICISHFIAHSNLFLLIKTYILELCMNYLMLRKKTKLISHRKGEFLKQAWHQKPKKTCIPSFIVATCHLSEK